MTIYIDADACPVKDETYKVATRYKIPVVLVANSFMKTPFDPLVQLQVVGNGFDAADDWIAETESSGDIVITADILLADRCVKNGVKVLGHKGDEFTEDNIGSAVAHRELMQELRYTGEVKGGPAPMDKRARSQFLGALDRIIQAIKRSQK